MSDSTKPIIAVTIGDPSGIGPEIALKALLDDSIHHICRPLLIGNASILAWYINQYELPLRLNVIREVQEAAFLPGTADVISIGSVDMANLAFGKNEAANGIAMLEYTDKAIALAMDGQVHAVIGGPHTKKAVELAGIAFDGYPTYVAKKTGTAMEDTFLMLVSDKLRIANVTVHVSLRDAIDMINKDLVLKCLQATDKAVRNLGVSDPKIAVSGLNPHAGEEGMFGMEEIEEINPAILDAQKQGCNAQGSFGCDTMFFGWEENKYDAYVCMYHDQAHLAIKLVAFDKITAFTIGTPVFFCTVGHGSAPDIAGKGIASANSLIESMRLMSNVMVGEN